MNKLYFLLDALVKYWPFMSMGQKNLLCETIQKQDILTILKILKEAEIEYENQTNQSI